MSLALIRAELQGILEGVSCTGLVHNYQRAVVTEEAVRAAFVKPGTNQLLGWTITRESTEEVEVVFGVQTLAHHQMVLRGYMGVNDAAASERTFQDLIEAVCAALRVRPSLAGAAWRSDPPQVRAVEHREFGGVLVHYAEIGVRVDELVQFTEITT